MQNSIRDRATRQTLKQMDWSSRGPHQVPLLLAKNRKLKLQFTWAQQNWTTGDWRNDAWPESQFLLQHLDGRIRICYKHAINGSILPCTNSSGSWYGGCVLGTLSAHQYWLSVI